MSAHPMIGKRVRVISGAHKGQRGTVEAFNGKYTVTLGDETQGEFSEHELEELTIRWRNILFAFYLIAFVLWAIVIAKALT